MSQSQVNELLLRLSRQTHDDGHHDHDETLVEHIDEDHDQSAVNIAKVTAMVVLFLASTFCGTVPFLLNKWFKWTENNTNARSAIVVKCLLYFGGGVLLSTTFLHLLPEVAENIESLQQEHKLPTLRFHLAELLMCLGFFTMFFVEEIIHAYIHKHQKAMTQDSLAFERGRSVRDSFLVKGRKKNSSISVKDENITSSKSSGISIEDLIKNDVESQKYEAQESAKNSHTSHSHQHNLSHHDHHQSDHHHHAHSHLPTSLDEDMIVSSLRGLLIVLALSLHELFEGLAVGLEASAGNVWYMFGAVSAHKLVLAFCVGVELIVTRTRLWLSIIYVITFAIVSPIGIGIGILVSNEKSAASAIPSAILQGLATGTLLYVVFFEILSKEKSGLIAYLAFIIGFFFMFGLQFATGHEHTHSHGGGNSHGHSHDGDHLHSHDDGDGDHTAEHATKSTEEQLKLLRETAGQLTTAFAQQFNNTN